MYNDARVGLHWEDFLENCSSNSYIAEVYPNRHGQMCPMLVSRVRFYYVNTLKVEKNCGKKLL